jgi:phosphoglycolate phosphatase
MSKKNFIFDLDGTLIDSASDIKEHLAAALRKNGINDLDQSRIRIGPPLENIIAKAIAGISPALIENIVSDYRKTYISSPLLKTIPFDGIMEILKMLNAKGLNVFIATFKPLSSGRNIIDRHFKGLYKDIITPSEIENFDIKSNKAEMINFLIKKHNLKAQDCVMIGDSWTDVDGAKQAGVFCIALLCGYGSHEELDGADIKVESIKELKNKIEELSRC